MKEIKNILTKNKKQPDNEKKKSKSTIIDLYKKFNISPRDSVNCLANTCQN